VEGVRIGSKVKQQILRHVGIAWNEEEEVRLKALGEDMIAEILKKRMEESRQLSLLPPASEEEIKEARAIKKQGRRIAKRIEDVLAPSQVTIDNLVEEERLVEGVHEVGENVYKNLGYEGILSKRHGRILKDLVLARLAFPVSKHRTQRYLVEKFGKEHDLDAIYRMMDKLFERIGYVKQCTFERMRSLFPERINMVLFDVTTLYFESVETDELRAFGYSKDCRFNTTQVVLALATNEQGLPIGYELFEGNKAEVKTLVEAIDNWKKLFYIGSVCFVGDRAMFSRANLALLEEREYKYVVAAKLRNLPGDMQEQLLCEQYYRPTKVGEGFAWVGEFEHESKRLIVSYKTQRAQKDAKDRGRALEKIQKLIGKKGKTRKLLNNQAVKKFTSTDATSETVLDEVKISNDARWDGLHGVITNIKDDAPELILARYAQLWIIEDSFRVNKHLLKIRPIFHWKPNRIHAHIAMCYMSFAILRHIQYRVELSQKVSPEIIMEELMLVQASIYRDKKAGGLYRIPGKFTNTARKIYKAFGISRSLDATIYF
jgi:transposase